MKNLIFIYISHDNQQTYNYKQAYIDTAGTTFIGK